MANRRWYEDDAWPPDDIMAQALGALMVGVVWALCFRSQVEQLKVSVVALMTLVAMEAVLFMAIRALA
jgi:hypothetical protein